MDLNGCLHKGHSALILKRQLQDVPIDCLLATNESYIPWTIPTDIENKIRADKSPKNICLYNFPNKWRSSEVRLSN